jgi:CBS domain-containing protein
MNRKDDPDMTFQHDDSSHIPALEVEDLRRSLRSLMKPAITVEIDTPIRDAILLMQTKRIGCVLVTSHEKLLGIFTERDVLKKIVGTSFDVRSTPITEVMTTNPQALNDDDTIAYALNFMDLGGYRHIPIVNEQFEPLGIVSVKDIVSYLVQHFADEVLNLPPHPLATEEDDISDNGEADLLSDDGEHAADEED